MAGILRLVRQLRGNRNYANTNQLQQQRQRAQAMTNARNNAQAGEEQKDENDVRLTPAEQKADRDVNPTSELISILIAALVAMAIIYLIKGGDTGSALNSEHRHLNNILFNATQTGESAILMIHFDKRTKWAGLSER